MAQAEYLESIADGLAALEEAANTDKVSNFEEAEGHFSNAVFLLEFDPVEYGEWHRKKREHEE